MECGTLLPAPLAPSSRRSYDRLLALLAIPLPISPPYAAIPSSRDLYAELIFFPTPFSQRLELKRVEHERQRAIQKAAFEEQVSFISFFFSFHSIPFVV